MRILEEVKDCRTIAVSGHIRPDGDCVGSCMAMYLFLKKAMPEARIDVFLGEFDDSLKENIAGTEVINHSYETDVANYDVFICLDCDGGRLGDAAPMFLHAAKKINIDHHITNPGTGDVNYIVPEASSACELVYDVIDHELIDEPIARSLYVGMVTDTGVFAYSNTSRRTMEIAGRLIEYGFDYPAVIDKVFFEKTYLQQQLLGRALVESRLFADNRCIISVIDRKTMNLYKASGSDTDGIASQLLKTKGVCCSIFIYEMKPQTSKVSMRSNGEVDVAKVTGMFGGGGHVRAAGCTINESCEAVMDKIMKETAAQLQSEN